MRSVNLAASIAIGLAITCGFSPIAAAQYLDTNAEAVEEENPYGQKGTIEFGGSISTSWEPSLFTIDLKPQIGWFVRDNLELSAILTFGHESEEDDGERIATQSGALLFEPSYHFSVMNDALFGFGGLGVGPGYDGDAFDFRLVPRVGLNIEVGSRALINPAVSVPIAFGDKKGENDDEFGVEAGFAVELGVTTVL